MSKKGQDAPDSESTAGVYVYGIVRAGASLEALDRAEEVALEVRLVEAGDLAALVSDSPEEATRELVLAHGHVLAAALESSPVVPLRFGMVVTTEDAVREEILEAHEDELAKLLERFEGLVQMTLKVYYHEDEVVAAILAADPEAERLREAMQGQPEDLTYKQRVALGERLNAAIEKQRVAHGKAILEPLEPLALAISREPPDDELMVAHVVFLLKQDRVSELESAVEELAQDRVELMRFRLLGPMPAYNFIDFQEPAWA
jgi:Gas vesicle synthesis protein GvpL/GvpF